MEVEDDVAYAFSNHEPSQLYVSTEIDQARQIKKHYVNILTNASTTTTLSVQEQR
jgi:hypothetical protein